MLLLVCIFNCHSLSAQYQATLYKGCTVTFPTKPQEMNQEGIPYLYNTLDKEHKVTALATMLDAAAYGMDSVLLAYNYNNPVFIDILVQSFLGQFAEVTIKYKQKIAEGKYMGYLIQLENDVPTEEIPYKDVYVKALFAGSKVYALAVLQEPNVAAGSLKDDFFASLKLD